MKKKLFVLLIAVFMFFPFIDVNALELTQAMFDAAKDAGVDVKTGNITYKDNDCYFLDADDYTVGDDFTVHNITFDEGESTLNLNNKTITGILIAEGSKLTIEGEGVLNGGLGVYSKGVNEDIPSEVTINGGTFFDIDVSYSKLVIENVNIEGEYHGITLNSGSDVVINGGTVNVGPEGRAFEVGSNSSENIKVVINGGTFRGGEYGLYAILESYDQLSLRGGAFNGSLAAIIVKSLDATSGDALNSTLTDLLGEGYTYSPNMTFTTEKNSVLWMAKTNQKDLFVVPNTNNNQNNSAVTLVSNTTNNPNTGDNIMFFITMFGLSVLGLTSVSLYKIYN